MVGAAGLEPATLCLEGVFEPFLLITAVVCRCCESAIYAPFTISASAADSYHFLPGVLGIFPGIVLLAFLSAHASLQRHVPSGTHDALIRFQQAR